MFYLHCSPCSYIACMWLYVCSSVKTLCLCALKQIKWIIITTVHGSDFIPQVFGHVMGRTPECRYLMGQKATLSRLLRLTGVGSRYWFLVQIISVFSPRSVVKSVPGRPDVFLSLEHRLMLTSSLCTCVTVRESLCVCFGVQVRLIM